MAFEASIRALLQESRRIAVVGLSNNPARPSYGVASFLQQRGYQIIPVNPLLADTVLGEQTYSSLRDVSPPVDIVNIFRRSMFVGPIVDDAISIGAKAVWMQLGVVDAAAAQRAEAAGLLVVMDRCIAVAHRQLIR